MDAPPPGLDLSLDDIIASNKPAVSKKPARNSRIPERGQGAADAFMAVERSGPARRSVLQRLGPPPVARSAREMRGEKLLRGEEGTLILRLRDTDVVKVWPSGELQLSSGGYATALTARCLEAALGVLGLKLLTDAATGEWRVSDGRALLRRFEDGMRVPPSPVVPDRAARFAAAYGGEAPGRGRGKGRYMPY